MHFKFRNVNDAFRELVQVFANPCREPSLPVVRRPSRNGDVLMIDEPVTVTYEKPLERVLFNAVRDANPFFHLMESLWMLAGRNDVAPVAYYAKQMREYSDDGVSLNGAYGHRWRRAKVTGSSPEDSIVRDGEYDTTDQLDVIVNHLKADPTSRRAVLQMWNVEDDLLKIGGKVEHRPINEVCDLNNGGKRCTCPPEYPPSKDVCCNLSVMFSLRADPDNWSRELDMERLVMTEVRPYLLDMTVTNRSNDMVWGMLGANYVHFTFLQEYVAARLGVEAGKYHHFTNNLHVYGWNWKPDEWLLWETKAGHPDYPQWPEYHGYGLGMHNPNGPDVPMKTVPLIKDPAAFERELPAFVDHAWGGKDMRINWSEPFLDSVACPAAMAFAAHKAGEPTRAMGFAETIQADDWRVACTNWLQRRAK